VVNHPGTVGTGASSDSEDNSEDWSIILEEQYSFQYSAAGTKVTNWRYDLAGIGAQFSGSEYVEYVFCHF
jgi:hypothetical protein